MSYDKKAITERKQSAIKSLVGLIDAVDSVPLDDNGQSDTFILDDGTEVMLSYQINNGTSTTTLTLGSDSVKYTIVEEKRTERLLQEEFRNDRRTDH